MVKTRTVKLWHKTNTTLEFLCSMTAIDDPDDDTNVILNDDNLDTIIDVLAQYKERDATDNGPVVTRPTEPRIPNDIDDRRYPQFASLASDVDD